MINTEIKPCPFCGSKNIVMTDCKELEACDDFEKCNSRNVYHVLICDMNNGGCGAATGYYTSEEIVIGSWNRRAESKLESMRNKNTWSQYVYENRASVSTVSSPLTKMANR